MPDAPAHHNFVRRPMPYLVRWLDRDASLPGRDAGHVRVITTHDFDVANKAYQDLIDAHQVPLLYLGGMIVRDDYDPTAPDHAHKSVAAQGAGVTPSARAEALA